MKWLPLFLLLMLACAQEPELNLEYIPPAQPAENVTNDTINDSEEETMPGETVIEEQVVYDKTGTFANIICENRELRFFLRNPTNLTWQLDQELPWPTPKGMAVIALEFDSVEMNGIRPVLFNRQKVFGPGEKFSDNCLGDALLEPGEETACALRPVPDKSDKYFHAAETTELRAIAPGMYAQVTFSCE